MNIFAIENDPVDCAMSMVDKHVVKMILETAQLLSTAHRVLDAEHLYFDKSKNGRNIKRWKLPDERDQHLYSATHVNHPSAVWCRQSMPNYSWLFDHFIALLEEYAYRYGKVHKCQETGLVAFLLLVAPTNIPDSSFTEPTPAMPDQYKVPGNSIKSYHNYYNGEKQRMFSWKQRPIPEFINKTTKENYATV